MSLRQLWFVAPGEVQVRETPLPVLAAGQVLVKAECSAISAGSELLVYRGRLPGDLALDATLASLQRSTAYPLPYGYACVGRVERIGNGVSPDWLDRRVFSFQPHASHFVAETSQLLAIPDDVCSEAAVFLANAETAVNLIHDGAPALGERVAVCGLGVVGLLLTGILAQFPLGLLVGLDGIAARRAKASALGMHASYDPSRDADWRALRADLNLPVDLSRPAESGADLIFEVSGAPAALNGALELAGYAGRIVVGSWYGSQPAPLQLGGGAHRHRLRIMTSQVSTIAPELSGRWDKARRFETAWTAIRRLQPQAWISHRMPLEQAATLYRNLDQTPGGVLQAVFRY